MLPYHTTINELVARIEFLVPNNPQILKLESVFGLFKIDGFKCDDLNPSLAQAQGALSFVKNRHKRGMV
ncbi:hypothetical protein KAU11_08670 [Candidatus Babeliales bacterium]|nr:hypothetical protein [Candidatus Babeliales bacterium]